MPTTQPWTDEERIGVPTPRRAAHAGGAVDRPVETPNSGPGRPTSAGRRRCPPTWTNSRRPTSSTSGNRRSPGQRRPGEAEKLLGVRPGDHPLVRRVRVPAGGGVPARHGRAVGFFVYSAVLSTPGEPGRPAGVGAVRRVRRAGRLGRGVLYAAVKFAVLYFKLRRNQQLNLRACGSLSNRTRLRWLAAAKAAEAKGKLETYLRSFPLDTEKDRKKLRPSGCRTKRSPPWLKARDELLDPDRFAGTEQWVHEFRERFQTELDVAAEERVSYWAKRIGSSPPSPRTPSWTGRRRSILRVHDALRSVPGVQPAGRADGHGGAVGPGVLQRLPGGTDDGVGEADRGPVERPRWPRTARCTN